MKNDALSRPVRSLAQAAADSGKLTPLEAEMLLALKNVTLALDAFQRARGNYNDARVAEARAAIAKAEEKALCSAS